MKRILAVVLAAALAGCATAPRYQPRPLREKASALFSTVEQPGAGLSMLVDLEAMREQGLVPPSAPDGQANASALVDFYMAMLPAMLAATESDTERVALARMAVYWTLLDRWAVWPHVQRFGVKVPMSADTEPTPERLLDTAVLLLAVDQDEALNRELIRGFAALGRSYKATIQASNELPEMDMERGELCIASSELPQALCLHGGEGFYALGTQTALRAALASAPGAAPEGKPWPKPDLFHVRFEMAQLGTTSVRLSGKDELKLVARIENAAPPFIAKLDTELRTLVARWDESNAATRTLVKTEVEHLQANLASDSKAPAGIKTAALNLSTDSVLDRDGNVAAMRRSLKIEKRERDFRVELTFPAPLVQKVSASLASGSGNTAVATMGIMAAIAIPNFIKFQCRSKQAEAKANLGAILQAQKSFQQERGGWASSFRDLGFSPELGNRYAYCMGGECLACTRDGCEVQGTNPCSIYQAAGGDFLVCAYGNLTGGQDTLDVWLLDSRGEPEQVSNDCSN